MSQHPRPRYTNKNSTQTLREGLEEYYTVNSDFTHPSTLPGDFAKVMFAHDASHVIYHNPAEYPVHVLMGGDSSVDIIKDLVVDNSAQIHYTKYSTRGWSNRAACLSIQNES